MSTALESLIADSITSVGEGANGRAGLAASHAGAYVGHYAAKLGFSSIILCDAGVGRDRAGVAALPYLQRLGIAAATIGHRSARIGDATDCLRRGTLSYLNACARERGLTAGMDARTALALLNSFKNAPTALTGVAKEARRLICHAEGRLPAVWILDSASLVMASDSDAIVVTGSHGALLGGRRETAIKAPVLAAIYNDADRGIDDAGVTRLAALDEQGVAGATVSAWSACIGDGFSTYKHGVISAVNKVAASLGGEVGLRTAQLVQTFRENMKARN